MPRAFPHTRHINPAGGPELFRETMRVLGSERLTAQVRVRREEGLASVVTRGLLMVNDQRVLPG
jgi:hypothetical protein